MELLRYALWVFLFLAAAGALGALAARGLRRVLAVAGGVETVSLGLGAESLVLFLLAAAQAWRGALLGAGFALAALAGIALLVRAAGRRRRLGAGGALPASWAGEAAPSAWTAVLAGLVVTVLALQFLLTCFPSVGWDAATYHLALPRLYLEHGGFREVALNLYSNWPLAGELLFGLAMAVRDYVLAKLVHWAVAALLVVALHAAGEAAGRGWGWIAAAVLLANEVVLGEIGGGYVDLFVALFLLLGFLALEQGLAAGDLRRIAAAGLFAGMAAATKTSAVLAVAALALVLVFRLLQERAPAADAARRLLAFALPVALCAAPWLLKAWWYTGNPVYPFLHAWLDGGGWNAALAEQATRWQRSIGMGRTLRDYLLLPLRVILAGGKGYARFDGALGAVWLVALPLGLAGAFVSRPARRALAVGGLYFAAWAATSQQMRLLVPALPLFALAAARGGAAWGERLAPRGRSVLAGLAALAAAAALAGPIVGAATPALEHAADVEVLGMARLKADIVPPVFRWIGAHTRADARILMVNANQVFFCPREALADSVFEASQIADWLRGAGDADGVARSLAAAGVTHVLVEHVDWGIAWPAPFRELLGDPRRARPVYRSPDGRVTLLELAPPSRERR